MLVAGGWTLASAQEPAAPAGRGEQLTRLADILGRVHHLRGHCARGESEIWRNRMQRLVELERMGGKARKALIDTFNAAFYDSRARFPDCSPSARAEAVALASEGRRLAAMLAPAWPKASQRGNSLDLVER
ncbi:MAG: TIGR02301 family protein [Pseudomonadota bacterium]